LTMSFLCLRTIEPDWRRVVDNDLKSNPWWRYRGRDETAGKSSHCQRMAWILEGRLDD
jgi:hypothetical protein